jgi:hypothetical protein
MKMASFYGPHRILLHLIFIVSYREQQIAKYIEEPWIKYLQTAATAAKHRQQKQKLSIVIE